MRILIVWLEEFHDDLDSILVQEQTSKPRDICIIGIHPLKNRLFRISLNANAQRLIKKFRFHQRSLFVF